MNILSKLIGPKEAPAPKAERVAVPADWNSPYETLRKKWSELPSTAQGRHQGAALLALPDDEFLATWKAFRDETSVWDIRGWYQELYRDILRDKKILDVGCGLGIDCIGWAQAGARVTFVDLTPTSLQIVQRVCKLLKVEADGFLQLVNVNSLKSLANDYDFIFGLGSLHNAPESVMRPQFAEMVRHLKPGGRWVQFAYPETRWRREGAPPFEVWGQMTDGDTTPYCEWYDVAKLQERLAPATFDPVFYYEWHNNDFNWIDLKQREK